MLAVVGKKQGGAGNAGYVLTVNSYNTTDQRVTDSERCAECPIEMQYELCGVSKLMKTSLFR